MRIIVLGVLLLAGSVFSCVVVEDRTKPPTRGAASQPLRAFVEQSGVRLHSVSAEVDGHLLPLSLDPVTGLYTGAYVPASPADRCKSSYSIRYKTVFQGNLAESVVTQYEPALGHYQHEATGLLPRFCSAPPQPLTIVVQITRDAPLAPGATTCVSIVGGCTLRAAITLANITPGHDLVVLASGSTYTLHIGTDTPMSSLHPHHLTIRDDLTIRASGGTPATITESGSHGKTLFDVNSSLPVTLQLQGLTITGFQSSGAVRVGVSENGIGGAITNTNGALIIDYCTFSNNKSQKRGGAIQNRGYLSIDHSTLTSNVAGYEGGAVAQVENAEGTSGLLHARIRNSTISNNQATFAGGGIYGTAGTLDIENVTIAGNGPRFTDDFEGGALCVAGSLSALVRQSTLANNTAFKGAGIFIRNGTLALANSIVANYADSSAGDSDVWGPVGASASGIGTNLLSRCNSTPTTTYTCPLADSTLILSTSPGLLPLALNAPGTTETYALTASSLARRRGPTTAANAADIATCLHNDQRGVDRSLPCDLGAYQF